MMICVIVCASSVYAGQGTVDGSEEGLFTEDRYCVVIAKVERVWKEKSIDSGDTRPIERAVLRPLATLAGPLDPSLHPTLSVRFYSGGPSTSIKEPPKVGSTVMAVVRLKPPSVDDDEPVQLNFIVSEICAFMPESSSLVQIKNLDDPQVSRTLSRIQEARKQGLEKRTKEKKVQEQTRRESPPPAPGK